MLRAAAAMRRAKVFACCVEQPRLAEAMFCVSRTHELFLCNAVLHMLLVLPAETCWGFPFRDNRAIGFVLFMLLQALIALLSGDFKHRGP